MLSHKIYQSLEFATTCLEQGMEAKTREEQLRWFKMLLNSVEYVCLVLEDERE